MLIHKGSKTLESERLVLRAFQYTDDADMLTYWINDPEIQSMYSEPVYTTKQEVKELLDFETLYGDVLVENHTYEIGYPIGEEEYLNRGISKIIIQKLEEKII